MADLEAEKSQLRERLREKLRRVPLSVREGSVQKARAFKDWHAKASKTIGSSRATLSELQSLHNQAMGLYE